MVGTFAPLVRQENRDMTSQLHRRQLNGGQATTAYRSFETL